MAMNIQSDKLYRVKGQSKYFLVKYGSSNPEILIEKCLDFHTQFNPPSFLFLGRALAEGISVDSDTYYGHIKGMGEYVHSSELEDVE